MDKVVHFEIPADNTDRAKKFYQEAFEWEFSDYPGMKYFIVTTVKTGEDRMPKESGAINGGMFKRDMEEDRMAGISLSVLVKDINEAVKKIKNAGGLIVKEKTPVGDMGFVAYFKDTEGNILSVFEAAQGQ